MLLVRAVRDQQTVVQQNIEDSIESWNTAARLLFYEMEIDSSPR